MKLLHSGKVRDVYLDGEDLVTADPDRVRERQRLTVEVRPAEMLDGGAERVTPRVRYEGSRRWYRGQIMQALCALPAGDSLTLDEVTEIALDPALIP